MQVKINSECKVSCQSHCSSNGFREVFSFPLSSKIFFKSCKEQNGWKSLKKYHFIWIFAPKTQLRSLYTTTTVDLVSWMKTEACSQTVLPHIRTFIRQKSIVGMTIFGVKIQIRHFVDFSTLLWKKFPTCGGSLGEVFKACGRGRCWWRRVT